MEGLIKASRNNRCPICGKPDWDMWMPARSGVGYAYFCHRADADCVGFDGRQYDYITPAGEAGALFFEHTEHMLSISQWKNEHGFSSFDEDKINQYRKSMRELYANSVPMEVQTVALAQRDRLNVVYRAFLSLLRLEPDDEKMLKDEWKQFYPELMKRYGGHIVSMPVMDNIRYRLKDHYSFSNAWRKQIVEKLITLIGGEENLSGVPGFYQAQGVWKFSGISGIIFPVYDYDGRIIRLRVRDRFPEVEGNYNGEKGSFFFDANSVSWKFLDKNKKHDEEAVVVYNMLNPRERFVALKKGTPEGKCSGKYKNFSSYKVEKIGDAWVNVKANGAKSGSKCSIYFSEDCDFSTVVFVEGEKKAMVMSVILGVVAVSVPGVGMFKTIGEPGEYGEASILSCLISRGMKNAVICYDADKSVNEQVLKAEHKFLEYIIKNDVIPYVGEWNQCFGKGADDAIIAGIGIDMYRYL